jgi:tyrosinase
MVSFANIGGERYLLGVEAVLSRWSIKYCANCQTHLEVKAHFGLHGLSEVHQDDVEVEIRTRDGVITTPGQNAARAMVAGLQPGKKLFHLEVR